MNRKSGFGLIGLVLVIVVAVGVLAGGTAIGLTTWRMDAQRTEIGLANRMDAQQNVVETSLFKMRATIKNMHGCTTEWADKFIQVVMAQASGRGGNRMALPEGAVAGVAAVQAGSTLQIGRESEALGLSPDLYRQLSNAIEGQLADFTRQQDQLTDIWNMHKSFCQDPYHNWFGLSLASKVRPEPQMITSKDTKDAVQTHQMSESLL